MSVAAKVKEIILEILDVNEAEIIPAADLRKDLHASSVDLVEIIAAVENAFDVTISDEEAPSLRTVQAICDFIQVKTA
ncbi:MAG: acyl carrier protein [Deltaproteobacteria bacterium]|nr:acyl carrier protein [Deltaproteobacteria bacterium]